MIVKNAIQKGGAKKALKRGLAFMTAFFLLTQSVMPVMADQKNASNPAESKAAAVSENAAEAVSERALEYLYLEETSLSAGQNGHILVAVETKEGEKFADANLTLIRKSTGEQILLPLSKSEDGSLVFETGTKLSRGVYGFGSLKMQPFGGSWESLDIAAVPGMEEAAFGVDSEVSFDTEKIGDLCEDEGLCAEGSGLSEDQQEELQDSVINLGVQNVTAGGVAAQLEAALANMQEDLSVNGEEALSAESEEEESLSAEQAKVQKVVIVLDPGHDDTHCGARANGLLEERLNFTVASYCKQYLEENYSNVTVYMTRTSNACPHPGYSSTDDNALRVEAAASVGANAYVSIHFNSTGTSATTSKGAMVFYPNGNYNASVSEAGRKLATHILANLVNLGLQNNGVKTYGSQTGDTYPDGSLADYYGVIRRSKLHGFPGIIIEHAFVNNYSDAAFCSSEENLKKLGIADAQGIASAFQLKEGPPVEEDGKTVNKSGFEIDCEVNKKETEVYLTLTGTSKSDKSVIFHVYSEEDDMDDIAAYEGEKESNKEWTATVDVIDHATAGDYKVFAYTVDSAGNQKKVATGSFTITGPSAADVTSPSVDKAKSTFRVQASGVNAPSGVKKVAFEVTNQNGEKKTETLDATRKGNVYYADVALANHGGMTGLYQVKVIVTDNTDIEKAVLTKAVTPDFPEPKMTVSLNKKQMKLILKAVDMDLMGKVEGVKFKVTAKSRRKTKSYTVTRAKSSGTYQKNVNISDFSAAGTYKIICYVKQNGKYTKVGAVKKIKVDDVQSASFTYAANGENGNVLTYGGVQSVCPVKEISVKVWPKIKRAAAHTYKAKLENNRWTATINKKYHQNLDGSYQCEATVTLKNGVKKTLTRNTFELGKDPVLYAIAGTSEATLNQLVAYYSAHATYPAFYKDSDASSLRKFCKLYIDECAAEGIKAEVAFCQAMKETNFLKYGGDVSISQFNFAGIGATGGGVPGNSYPSVQIGIRAQIQHLKAYASLDPLANTCVDDRFIYVNRNTAPYVEWLGIPDNPYGKGWATDTNYGGSILGMINELLTYQN